MGYQGLQLVRRDCKWLKEVTGAYKGLKGVTRGYRKLQRVTTS